MNRTFRMLTAGLLVLCAGCAHGSYTRISQSLGAATPMDLPGDDVERRELSVNVEAVPALGESVLPLLPGDSSSFRAMREEEVRDRAAAASVLGDLLLQESDAAAAQGTRHSVDPSAVQVLRTTLVAQSVAERNRSAGDALESLLLLAEAEDGLNRLASSLREVEGMGQDLQQVRKQGMAVPMTETQIEGQRLGLLHQLQQTQATSCDLNRKLAELLGIDDTETHRIWPDVELAVDPTPLDPEVEVATALATRTDLAVLAYLRCSVTPETLPAIRQMLAGTTGGLGMALAAGGLGHWSGQKDTGESQHRRDQIETLYASRQRTAARDVRAAVASIDLTLRLVATSNQQVRVQNQQVGNLNQQRTIGAATPLDVRRARLDLLKMEQQLFHDVIQWKIAVVRLHVAQGRLAADSGYGLPLACPGESGP